MKYDNDIIEIKNIASSVEKISDSFFKENIEYIKLAIYIRSVENTFLRLFSEAKINGTVHTCIGQEFSGIAVSKYLLKGDIITSNHRCHGHYIAYSKDWKSLIDELLGLNTGVSKGIGSSQHLYKDRFFSNGTQGSLLPVATGMAHFLSLKNTNNLTISFIGEGTFGEGNIYESLNLSSLLEAPHVIVCENNFYSQSTSQKLALAGSIQLRAEAFGLKFFETNTWDLNHLFKTVKEAFEYSRSRNGPSLINIKTYRLKAHSKGDDDRSSDEINEFYNLDTLNQIIANFEINKLVQEIEDEVFDYTESKIKFNNLEDYFSFDEYTKDQLPRNVTLDIKKISNEKIQFSKALNNSYKKLLNDGAFFIGEDIADPYGGAFKITKGFQTEKPNQVISTPISEAGLTGMGIGLSLFGERVFVEIMFGDFIVNAIDQIINNASKIFHMYGKQLSSPIVIRTPMGGRRGYGPTHSQSLEKLLLGIDNLAVCSFTSLIDPNDMIHAIDKLQCPTLLIENKTDYSSFLWDGSEHIETTLIGGDLGSVHLRPIGAEPEVTIIAYGYLGRYIANNFVHIFREADILFELIVPQLIHPFPKEHVIDKIKKTKKVLILEEGSGNFGWSDGVLSQLIVEDSGLKIKSLSSDPVPIPSVKLLEDELLINKQKIVNAIKSLIWG